MADDERDAVRIFSAVLSENGSSVLGSLDFEKACATIGTENIDASLRKHGNRIQWKQNYFGKSFFYIGLRKVCLIDTLLNALIILVLFFNVFLLDTDLKFS